MTHALEHLWTIREPTEVISTPRGTYVMYRTDIIRDFKENSIIDTSGRRTQSLADYIAAAAPDDHVLLQGAQQRATWSKRACGSCAVCTAREAVHASYEAKRKELGRMQGAHEAARRRARNPSLPVPEALTMLHDEARTLHAQLNPGNGRRRISAPGTVCAQQRWRPDGM